MTKLKELQNILKNAENTGNFDKDKATVLIKAMKKDYLGKDIYNLSNVTNLDTSLLIEARTFHECCIFLFVHTNSFKEFEKHFFRVQYFYKELKDVIGTTSANYDKIMGIYLLFLLTFNRVAEFHLFLSSIPVAKHSEPLYLYSINLERDITIGNYMASIKAHSSLPCPYYKIFLGRISETIRHELFRSLEASVEQINVSDILKILRYDKVETLMKSIESEKTSSKKRGFVWSVNGEFVVIKTLNIIEKNIDADEVVRNMLSYAHEIEMIN